MPKSRKKRQKKNRVLAGESSGTCGTTTSPSKVNDCGYDVTWNDKPAAPETGVCIITPYNMGWHVTLYK